MTRWKTVKVSLARVLVNVVVLRTCWSKSYRRGKHGVHCLEVVVFVGVRNFSLFFIVFVPIGCFKNTLFRKAIMGRILLNVSLKLLFMLNMCRCFFVTFLIFGSNRLCVTQNGIEPLHLGLQCLKRDDPSRWSTLSSCFLTVDSLKPFSKKFCFRFWECFLYSSKVELMRLNLSGLNLSGLNTFF